MIQQRLSPTLPTPFKKEVLNSARRLTPLLVPWHQGPGCEWPNSQSALKTNGGHIIASLQTSDTRCILLVLTVDISFVSGYIVCCVYSNLSWLYDGIFLFWKHWGSISIFLLYCVWLRHSWVGWFQRFAGLVFVNEEYNKHITLVTSSLIYQSCKEYEEVDFSISRINIITSRLWSPKG